jgi:threonine/homoserine/homoserine lactone efflux protein
MNHIGDLAQLIGALVLAFNCWQTWRNGQKSNRIAENVQTIEKATNGMREALIASTAKASHAEGAAAGLEQGRSESRGN